VSALSGDTGSSTSIVEKIASKFNLNKAEVQKVFDEERTVHEAEHQQAMKDRLAQAVKDGKLTQDQADKITAKQAEMKAYMDSLKDKTHEERHMAMESKRTELEQWAKDNNIPTEYLGKMGGRGGHGGGR
jgi:hypothetical protein